MTTRVQKLNYSSYFDVRTGIEFKQVEDKRIQQLVAVADVPDDKMSFFATHPGFKVITDAEYSLMLGIKPADPTAPAAGAPLVDAPPSPDELETAKVAAFNVAVAQLEADTKAENDKVVADKATKPVKVVAPVADPLADVPPPPPSA